MLLHGSRFAQVWILGGNVLTLAVSLTLGYSYRVTEVDDVLLNLLGVLLGYGLLVALRGSVAAPVEAAKRPDLG